MNLELIKKIKITMTQNVRNAEVNRIRNIKIIEEIVRGE
jgi:hypothetical protein